MEGILWEGPLGTAGRAVVNFFGGAVQVTSGQCFMTGIMPAVIHYASPRAPNSSPHRIICDGSRLQCNTGDRAKITALPGKNAILIVAPELHHPGKPIIAAEIDRATRARFGRFVMTSFALILGGAPWMSQPRISSVRAALTN
jgi:hypothetical protein